MRRSAYLLTGLVFSLMTQSRDLTLYIATQDPARMGITAAQFDTATGKLSPPKMLIETRDPAHFTLSRDGKHLYLCNTGTPGGVSAFEIARDGALRLLNHRPAPGRGPSYISLDHTGRFVLDANYGGGFVEVHAIEADGSLGERTAFVQHEGSSAHPQRQTKPYAHWIGVDPGNRFALAADLGTDKVVVYQFDAKTGTLTPNNPAALSVQAGFGPRHLMFHPDGKFVYAIEELGNQVTALAWNAKGGTLTEIQSVSTLPADFTAQTTAAEIGIHRSGKFLYASNRGHDSLAVFSIDEKSGRLALVQRVSSGGKVPRYFVLDPTSHWLIVGNQDSGNIVVFAIDQKTGELRAAGEPLAFAKPYGMAWKP
jgi:6-phosphogluconolactonase